jgi:hypothetical protein
MSNQLSDIKHYKGVIQSELAVENIIYLDANGIIIIKSM